MRKKSSKTSKGGGKFAKKKKREQREAEMKKERNVHGIRVALVAIRLVAV